MNFDEFILRKQYGKVQGLGDRLAVMKDQIAWEPFIPLVRSVFHDDKVKGGRPHTDELVVVRSMLLQAWYGLSDPELEFQCHDRLSFRHFLGFPQTIPDFTTIWKIRDRLVAAGVDQLIWGEVRMPVSSRQIWERNGISGRRKHARRANQ